ncbi:MAG TPA: DUF5110 domain-containing protein, partial [Gemmatimonadaceae bacterium]|nr:DUF5110 domain-containing protein [Gemmatimonadaceae bacterium]
GRRYQGGARVEMPVTIESLPIFVRGGAFVFRSSVIQHTGERAGQPLRVTVFPADKASAVLYEDDGETRAYEHGAWMTREFSQVRTAPGGGSSAIAITIAAPQGSYRPAARPLVVEVRTDREPQAIALNGAPVSRQSGGAASNDAAAWTFDPAGYVSITLPDRFERTEITIR